MSAASSGGGFRFQPPPHAASAEERWCLLRAFAPPGAPTLPIDASGAVGVARALGLGTRIAGRLGPARLHAELDAHAGRALLHDYGAAMARAQALAKAAHELAVAAAETGTPLVLLKRAALVALKVADDAQREAVDVDALVPEDALAPLQRLLVARGWRAGGTPPADHQAAPLAAPDGTLIELHRFVPGIRVEGSRREARFEDLERAGALVALAGWPGRVHAPSRDLLAAHALAHGLDQHGLAPGSYPLARMLADLADLGAAGCAPTWKTLAPWTRDTLSRDEAEAAFELVDALRRGAGPSSPQANDLLRHILAAAADPSYHASLRQRALVAQLASGAPRDRSRLLAGVLFPSRAQLDAIYGGPRSALGYALLRVWRPLDLTLRLVLYVWRSRRPPPWA